MPLAGKTLTRDNGKTNRIVNVDWSGIERITSNGKHQKIGIEIFRFTMDRLFTTGRITRDEINQNYAKRASSGIVLILSQAPCFRLVKQPAGIGISRRISALQHGVEPPVAMLSKYNRSIQHES